MTCDDGPSPEPPAVGADEQMFSLEFGNAPCVGCRPSGQCRFGLSLHRADGPGVAGVIRFSKEHEGAGGVTHGGSVMGALDEACGAVPISVDVLAVTARFDVEFLRPVPLGREVEIRAWPQSRDERGNWIIHAEISLAEQLLCRAVARFVERDPDKHYRRFRDWLDELPEQD